MAEGHKSSSGGGSDIWWFLGLLVIIFFLWVAGGGPDRAELEGLGKVKSADNPTNPYSVQTPDGTIEINPR